MEIIISTYLIKPNQFWIDCDFDWADYTQSTDILLGA